MHAAGEQMDSIELMAAVQEFTSKRLACPEVFSELHDYMREHKIDYDFAMMELAKPEIVKACELLVPGLMVEFLMNNPHAQGRM
jgi:hypothetical protein